MFEIRTVRDIAHRLEAMNGGLNIENGEDSPGVVEVVNEAHRQVQAALKAYELSLAVLEQVAA